MVGGGSATVDKSIRKCGVSRRASHLFSDVATGQTGIPSFKLRPQRPVERSRSRLQEEMGTASTASAGAWQSAG